MKIRSQILLAQIPTVLIILAITILFILALTSVRYKTESIMNDNFKGIISIQQLGDTVAELNRYISHHPQSFDDKAKKLEIKIAQKLLFPETSLQGSEEEQELTQALKKQWESYKESIHSSSKAETSERNYEKFMRIVSKMIALKQDDLIRQDNNLINFLIDFRFFVLFFSLVGLLFGCFMSWIFTGLFLVPLKKMTETVSQFGTTDETILLHIKGSEEIEKLSNEFNLMTNRLEEYHQSSFGRLVEDYENLKRAFDAPPYPLLIFCHNNDIIFMNRAALRLFGDPQNLKVKNPLFYIENSLREALLKIVTRVQLTKKPYMPTKTEEPIAIFKEKKKSLFMPFAYPIKGSETSGHLRFMNVLVILQDLRLQSFSELETAQIITTFIQEFQAPLTEIQMALYTIIQESTGPLTEKQKEILYIAREKCDELETLYQKFRKISRVNQ